MRLEPASPIKPQLGSRTRIRKDSRCRRISLTRQCVCIIHSIGKGGCLEAPPGAQRRPPISTYGNSFHRACRPFVSRRQLRNGGAVEIQMSVHWIRVFVPCQPCSCPLFRVSPPAYKSLLECSDRGSCTVAAPTSIKTNHQRTTNLEGLTGEERGIAYHIVLFVVVPSVQGTQLPGPGQQATAK